MFDPATKNAYWEKGKTAVSDAEKTGYAQEEGGNETPFSNTEPDSLRRSKHPEARPETLKPAEQNTGKVMHDTEIGKAFLNWVPGTKSENRQTGSYQIKRVSS